MKKTILLLAIPLLSKTELNAQFSTYLQGTDQVGFTNSPVRAMGLGLFTTSNLVSARLHIRNNIMASPTLGPFNGALFRTDGLNNVSNSWTMFTGTGNVASGYAETFRLETPSGTNNFLLQATNAAGEMRFNTGGTNLRAIITSAGNVGVNTATPGNRFELNSGTLNVSGFRFTQLNSSSPASISTSKVLSVDANGDVFLAIPSGGSGSTPPQAQNGLSVPTSPFVELGGSLYRNTSINQNNFEMAWFNKGRHIFQDVNTTATSFPNSWDPKFYVESTARSAAFNSRVNVASGTAGINTTFGAVVENLTQNGFANTAGKFISNSNASSVGIDVTATTSSNLLNSSNNVTGVSGFATGGFVCTAGSFGAVATTGITSKAFGVVSIATGNGSSEATGVFGGVLGTATTKRAVYGSIAVTNSGETSYGCFAEAVSNPGLANTVNYGVYGNAGNAAINYGVYGTTGNGALLSGNAAYAIYGDASGFGTYPIKWAGYFNGNVNVAGTLFTTTGLVSVSDQSLKKDVKAVKDALSILAKLSPKSYNLYNDNCKQLNFEGTKTQFGLIAQEVEKVLPEIVYDLKVPAKYDEKGSVINEAKELKGVNYTQLIAVLIKGVQEQQTQISQQQARLDKQDSLIKIMMDKMVATNSNTGSQPIIGVNNQVDVDLSDKDVIVLKQNVPNPFAEQTTITYNVPASIVKAQIIFYNNTGQLIHAVDIKTRGKGKVNVFASDLSSGLYNYTLVADGKVIDSKKMVRE
jgi:hypothetical protein